MLGLGIVSLAMTSCTDKLERGAKAFLSEFQNETEVATEVVSSYPDSSIPSAYANPVSVTDSPGLAAYDNISSSNPTTGLGGGVSTYEQGFREGFTSGFNEGAKVKATIASTITDSVKANNLVAAASMKSLYAANSATTQTTKTAATTTNNSSSYKKPSTSYSSSSKWNSSNNYSKYNSSRSRNCYGGS